MERNLVDMLEPIAAWFRSLGTPEPIVRWGHPAMMGIVVLVLGGYTALAGWRGRLSEDGERKVGSLAEHRKLAPWLFLFLWAGYAGGILSLLVQERPILESPHFWTGSFALAVLGVNSSLAFTGFGGERKELFRTVHARAGAVAMVLLLVHGILGLQLGLSL